MKNFLSNLTSPDNLFFGVRGLLTLKNCAKQTVEIVQKNPVNFRGWKTTKGLPKELLQK